MRRNFRMHLDGICISGSSHLYYGNRHETHVFPGELDNNMNCSSPIAPKLNPAEVYYTFSFFFVFVMLFYILLVSFVRSFVPSFLRSFLFCCYFYSCIYAYVHYILYIMFRRLCVRMCMKLCQCVLCRLILRYTSNPLNISGQSFFLTSVLSLVSPRPAYKRSKVL